MTGEAATPEEALRLTGDLRPQVAIIDLRLKDGDGLQVLREVHAVYPGVRLLLSSVNDEELFADLCLKVGASGYVAKSQPAEALVAAIERALSGGIYLSEKMTDRMVPLTAGRKTAVFALDTLTRREREVYDLIGQGRSVRQIARELDVSGKTVEYHRQQLKSKLQLDSGAELARHATVHSFQRNESSEATRGGN